VPFSTHPKLDSERRHASACLCLHSDIKHGCYVSCRWNKGTHSTVVSIISTGQSQAVGHETKKNKHPARPTMNSHETRSRHESTQCTVVTAVTGAVLAIRSSRKLGIVVPLAPIVVDQQQRVRYGPETSTDSSLSHCTVDTYIWRQ
jgi:hypothetical protein